MAFDNSNFATNYINEEDERIIRRNYTKYMHEMIENITFVRSIWPLSDHLFISAWYSSTMNVIKENQCPRVYVGSDLIGNVRRT